MILSGFLKLTTIKFYSQDDLRFLKITPVSTRLIVILEVDGNQRSIGSCNILRCVLLEVFCGEMKIFCNDCRLFRAAIIQ